MPNNYLFLDADSSVLTAHSSVTSGTAHEPIVIISSILSPVPVVSSGNQSVSGTVNIAGNPSISGTVNIAGTPSISGAVTVVGNPSISGTVDIGTIPGSVLSQQLGTRIASVISSTPSSMLVGASIIGLTPVTATITGNPSISGTVNTIQSGTAVSSLVSTVPSSVIVGASIFGQLPAGSGVIGSVAALQGTNPWRTLGSVSGTVDIGVIPGSVLTYPKGTIVSSLVSTVPSSVIVGASIFGQLPAGAAVIGSVAALQGTNPWRTLGSVSGTVDIGVSSGSVVAHQGTNPWVVGSIVGTYAEDAGHTSGEKGLFVLGVRNDAVASFASANLDYTPQGVDSAGRQLIKPFAAEEARIEGYVSLTSTSVTTLVAAAGAGLKNYITDLWFANTGSVTTLVTLKDGAGSVLGYTIAPASSGSNLPGLVMPIRTGANATFDIQAASPTSTLYATVKGFKAP